MKTYFALPIAALFLLVFSTQPSTLFASAILGHSSTTTLQNGLVGYWPLDGNTDNFTTGTSQDLSGSGNTGALVSFATSTAPVAGKIGGALKFNPGYISIPDATSLNPTTAITISMWGKKTSTATVGQAVSKFDSVSSSVPYEIQWWNNGSIFANFKTTGGFIGSLSCPYAANTWYHVVATYDGTTAKLYLNGVKCNSVSTTGTIISAAKNLYIGSSGGGSLFNGTIDDVRVYNRALSAQEVTQLYKQGATVAHSNTVSLTSGLVGYWPLDGNTTSWTSNTTRDVSGQGNTGTLTSMSTTTSPVPGKIGGALLFNGSTNYIQTLQAGPTGSNARTVVAWVKTTSGTAFSVTDWGTDASLQRNSFFVGAGTVGIGLNSANIFYTATNVSNGKWHQVAFSMPSGSSLNGITFYEDGVPLSTVSSSANATNVPNTGNTAVLIGKGESGDFFPGTIDDVHIYNRALSSQEIAQLYAQGAANVAHANTAILSSGLIGYWPLDGGTTSWTSDTTRDISGQGNTGSLVSLSTTTSPVAGKVGGALKINGTGGGVINVTGFTSTTLSNYPITIGLWAKLTSSQAIAALIGQNASASGWRLQIDTTNSRLQFRSDTITGTAPVSTIANLSAWNFYAITINTSGTLTYYVNGIAVGTNSSVAALNWASGNLVIGNGGALNSGSLQFTGPIDDVRVYNRALSAQEIFQLYQAGR